MYKLPPVDGGGQKSTTQLRRRVPILEMYKQHPRLRPKRPVVLQKTDLYEISQTLTEDEPTNITKIPCVWPLTGNCSYASGHIEWCSVCRVAQKAKARLIKIQVQENENISRTQVARQEIENRLLIRRILDNYVVELRWRMKRRNARQLKLQEWFQEQQATRTRIVTTEGYRRKEILRAEHDCWADLYTQHEGWLRETTELFKLITNHERDATERRARELRENNERLIWEQVELDTKRRKHTIRDEELDRRSILQIEESERQSLLKLLTTAVQRLEMTALLEKQQELELLRTLRDVELKLNRTEAEEQASRQQVIYEEQQNRIVLLRTETESKKVSKHQEAQRKKVIYTMAEERRVVDGEEARRRFEILEQYKSDLKIIKDVYLSITRRLRVIHDRRLWRMKQETLERKKMHAEQRTALKRLNNERHEQQRLENKIIEEGIAAEKLAKEQAERLSKNNFNNFISSESRSRALAATDEDKEWTSLLRQVDAVESRLCPIVARKRYLRNDESKARLGIETEEQESFSSVISLAVENVIVVEQEIMDLVRQAKEDEDDEWLAKFEESEQSGEAKADNQSDTSSNNESKDDEVIHENTTSDLLESSTTQESLKERLQKEKSTRVKLRKKLLSHSVNLDLGTARVWVQGSGSLRLWPTSSFDLSTNTVLHSITITVSVLRNSEPGDELFIKGEVIMQDDELFTLEGAWLGNFDISQNTLKWSCYDTLDQPLSPDKVNQLLRLIAFNNQSREALTSYKVIAVKVSSTVSDVDDDIAELKPISVSLEKRIKIQTWPPLLQQPRPSCPYTPYVVKREGKIAKGALQCPQINFGPQYQKSIIKIKYIDPNPHRSLLNANVDFSLIGEDDVYDIDDCVSLQTDNVSIIDTSTNNIKLGVPIEVIVSEGSLVSSSSTIVITLGTCNPKIINTILHGLIYSRLNHGSALLRAISLQLSVVNQQGIAASTTVDVLVDMVGASTGTLLAIPYPAQAYRISRTEISDSLQSYLSVPKLKLFPGCMLRSDTVQALHCGGVIVCGMKSCDQVGVLTDPKPTDSESHVGYQIIPIDQSVGDSHIYSSSFYQQPDDDDDSTGSSSFLITHNSITIAKLIEDGKSLMILFTPGRCTVQIAEELVSRIWFSCVGDRDWKRCRGKRDFSLKLDLGVETENDLRIEFGLSVQPPLITIPPSLGSVSYKEASDPVLLAGLQCIEQKEDELYVGAYLLAKIISGSEESDVLSLKNCEHINGSFQLAGIATGTLEHGPGSLKVNFGSASGKCYSDIDSMIYVNPLEKLTKCISNGWIMRLDPHVKHTLRSLEFHSTSLDPQELRKVVAISLYDGRGGITSQCLEVDVQPVNDSTELRVNSTKLHYRQGSRVAVRGFQLLPGCSLCDPDSHDFSKGSCSVELVGGGDGQDRLDFVSISQQQDAYAVEKVDTSISPYDPDSNCVVVPEGGPHPAFTSPILWLSLQGDRLLLNNIAIANAIFKSSGVKGTQATQLHIQFNCKFYLPLQCASYALACICYESTARRIYTGQRWYQVKVNANDGPVPDTRLRVQIMVHGPYLWVPSFAHTWKYTENCGTRAVNKHIKCSLRPDDPATGILTCKITNPVDPNDELSLVDPDNAKWVVSGSFLQLQSMLPIGKKLDSKTTDVDKSKGGNTSEVVLAKIWKSESEIQIRFHSGCAALGRHIEQLTTSFSFRNQSQDPATEPRLIEISYCEREEEEEWGSTVTTTIDVIATDDLTRVELSTDKLSYLLGQGMTLRVADTAIVSDPDTPIFEGPDGYLAVTFLSGSTKLDRLDLHPSSKSKLAITPPDIFYDGEQVGVISRKARDGGLGRQQYKILFIKMSLLCLQEVIRSVTYSNPSRREPLASRCIGIHIKDKNASQTVRVPINIDLYEPFIDLSGCREDASRPAFQKKLAQVRITIPSFNETTIVLSVHAEEGGKTIPWDPNNKCVVPFKGITLRNKTELMWQRQKIGIASISANEVVVCFYSCLFPPWHVHRFIYPNHLQHRWYLIRYLSRHYHPTLFKTYSEIQL